MTAGRPAKVVFATFLHGVEAMIGVRPGRPKATVDLDLVRQLRAKGWGYRRIAACHCEQSSYVCPNTIRRVISELEVSNETDRR